ncbi:MAG: M28 family peptidase [Gemmatimonadetes bacterium]|nr:M28 family peptidase [Gemmatimonadota bacterium]
MLVAVAGCAEGGAEGGGRASSSIAEADRAAPDFRGDTAMALVRRQVEFGPRVPGTAGHRAQLEWMTSYLRDRADTVVLQPFTHTGPADERLEMTNVFARFRPDMPERVLLVAHWDTRPTADSEATPERRAMPIQGANDGASGTAVLLELANVLSSHSPPIGVDLLLVDGEDYAPDHMYLGATYFAENKPPGYEPYYGILLDMVGDENPVFLQEGYSVRYAPEVVDRVWRMAERLGYSHMFPRTHGIPIKDDHVPLNEAGIRTIDIIDFEYGPGNAYWHTLEDTLEHVAVDGLEATGTVVAELIYRGG